MMRFAWVALISTLASSLAYAQGPFDFREASLLLNRVELQPKATKYDPAHGEQWMSRMAPSPTRPFEPNLEDPRVYADTRWIGLVQQADQFRDMGGYAIAEKRYRDIIAMLRKVQGGSTSDVALMLDHLAELHLEMRDFEAAYDGFTEAVKIRRENIAALEAGAGSGASNAAAAAQTAQLVLYGLGVNPSDVAAARKVCRLHLADLLTQLARLDLSKGDLTRANGRLAEAVGISNENGYKHFATGLYALYFQSKALEQQARWDEAEKLWQNAVSLRENMGAARPYWDALKEMAAFYARHGDFHTAAATAQRVVAGMAGKRFRPALAMPYLIQSRPWMDMEEGADSYTVLSNTAMSEILAIDAWKTSGPEAGAALLKDPMDRLLRNVLSYGSDSERARMLGWLLDMAYLQMSVLLDAAPSQERIDQAYGLLSQLKGRYLAGISNISKIVEQNRSNPGAFTSDVATLDQLADARARHANLFVASAIDGRPYDRRGFAETENLERVLSTALTANAAYPYYEQFSSKDFPTAVPDSAVLIDITAWLRTDRMTGRQTREYAAFVSQRGQRVRFVPIGPAQSVEADIATLDSAAIDGRARGLKRMDSAAIAAAENLPQTLRNLYQKVIAPLESSVQGRSHWYVVPDGKLALTPIGAFMDPSGRFLLETHTITYLNSWRDLHAWREAPTSAPIIIANPDFTLTLGPGASTEASYPPLEPLPGTETEARAIEKILGLRHDRTLVGKAARKWLVQSLRGPQILHFATHSEPYLRWESPPAPLGLFEFPQPLATANPLLQSIIALAGADRIQSGEENGFLSGLEIVSLDLQGTRLVVLSSCESAQGTPVDGQGVMGLRAAFGLAGAQSLVMSLWPVDDQAGSQFMQFFYAHLAQGAAEAVRLAQLDMLTKTDFKKPFYWAGYVVSGDESEGRPQPARPAAGATATATTAVTAAIAVAVPEEVFTTPSCFELVTREKQDSITHLDTIRLKIGGALRRLESSPTRAVYNLDGPGNDLTEMEETQLNGVLVPPIEIKHADSWHWTVTLTLEKQADHSALLLRFGDVRRTPEEHRVISLIGGPTLFASLTPPETLPGLSAYSQSSDSWNKSAKLERVGACSSPPGS